VLKTEIHKISDVGFADTHDGIGTAPVDFDSAIGLWDCSATENDIVDIASDLPGILRLQDP
jgi:hypothetical protein